MLGDKIRMISLFGGIGAETCAVKRMFKIDEVEVVEYVEKDKYAVKTYNAINGSNFKPKDIKDIDLSKFKDIDLLTAGWPCQDFSNAGYGLGLDGTRSSLILTTIKKIKEMKDKPKYILLENVKGLLNSKFENDLEFIKNEFDKLGYNWSQALLNAKNFGVAQNRERVYIFLTRKDLRLKVIHWLENEKKFPVNLKDILEYGAPTHELIIPKLKNKDSKYSFLYFKNKLSNYRDKIIQVNLDLINYQRMNEINKVATLGTLDFDEKQKNKIKSKIIKSNGEKIIAINKDLEKVIPFAQDRFFIGIHGVSQTLTTSGSQFKNKIIYTRHFSNHASIHYRNLTTLEVWRLMGFTEREFNKVKNINSKTQLCKQAGNSIVINVLQTIFNLCLADIKVRVEKSKKIKDGTIYDR